MPRLSRSAKAQVDARVKHLLEQEKLKKTAQSQAKVIEKENLSKVLTEFPVLSQIPKKIIRQMINEEGFENFIKRMHHEELKLEQHINKKLLGS